MPHIIDQFLCFIAFASNLVRTIEHQANPQVILGAVTPNLVNALEQQQHLLNRTSQILLDFFGRRIWVGDGYANKRDVHLRELLKRQPQAGEQAHQRQAKKKHGNRNGAADSATCEVH